METGINFKIIVLGSQGVGKSSLIMRYIKGQFQENYNVTVGVQFATKILQVQSGDFVRLQVWDTAGQEFFRAMVRSFYKGISCVFFVFAIDYRPSFKELEEWVAEVRQNAHEEVVFFLIGTRSDSEKKREVSSEEASEFMKKIKGALYVQTSAKTGQNIDLLFNRAADILYKKVKASKAFAELVMPDQHSQYSRPFSRQSMSLMLKKDTLPQKTSLKHKKKCCQ